MKTKLNENVTLNCIQSDKFKDIVISINFLTPLNQFNATARSVLALMLCDRCSKYDTKSKMNEAFDHLYGATLSCRGVGYGCAHNIELRSKVIDSAYVSESSNLLNDWIELISEVLFYPLLINDQFSLDMFEEAKHVLIGKLKRRLDDGPTVSVIRVFDIAGANQPLAISSRGDLEDLEKLTASDVLAAYQKMIREDQIEIVVCGQFDETRITKLIKQKLSFEPRSTHLVPNYTLLPKEYECVTETKDIAQSSIAMVLTTDINCTDELYPALKVANGILGQYPSSYLFQVVREQHSLCYSIYSNLMSFDGAIVISTGIESDNIDKTIQLIQAQIQRCQDGDFDEEMIATCKKMQINSLTSSLDEMGSIVGYAITNQLLNREQSIAENIQRIKDVTPDQIKQAFKKMQLITTFVLKGEETNE